MNLKTYQARTMSDALAEVKRDLGRDAVILHTRSFRKGGLFGLGGRHMWEITAAPNVNVPSRLNRATYVSATTSESHNVLEDSLAQDSGSFEAVIEPAIIPDQAPGEPRGGFLGQQITELRRMVEALVVRQADKPDTDLPPELLDFHVHLASQDVAHEIARDLIGQLRLSLTGQQLADRRQIRSTLAQLIASLIPCAPQDEAQQTAGGRVIALIGPTGVGKTTTIAKMAANFKIRHGKRVGLVTIDTYRIAAVDQLRTYADIIDIPLQTVLTAGELHQTVRSMRDLDVVLIDTAGRSQNDRLRLNQLRSFLSAAQADEVHLAISATANRRCATSILERFIPLGANRVIITKLDEAETFGTILNVAAAGKVPLSYVTAGQDVPEDISAADPNRLAGWILNGSMTENSDAP